MCLSHDNMRTEGAEMTRSERRHLAQQDAIIRHLDAISRALTRIARAAEAIERKRE